MKVFIFIFITLLILTVAAIFAAFRLNEMATAQENVRPAQKQENVEYRIVRDTVYIDRARPINKPWYSYEIECMEDSIYLYSGRELIKAVGRKEATVFSIDSIIILDNL